MFISMKLLFLPHLFYYGWQTFKEYSLEAAREAAKWDLTVTYSADGRVRTTKRRNRETNQVISIDELVDQSVPKKKEEARRVVAKRVVKQQQQGQEKYDAGRRVRIKLQHAY